MKKNYLLGILVLVLSLTFVSCEKEPIEPEAPQAQVLGGSDVGTVDPVEEANELNGKIYQITQVVFGSDTEHRNDTLYFVSNTEYVLNGDTNTYVLENHTDYFQFTINDCEALTGSFSGMFDGDFYVSSKMTSVQMVNVNNVSDRPSIHVSFERIYEWDL